MNNTLRLAALLAASSAYCLLVLWALFTEIGRAAALGVLG
jgi:hypothetical protein